MLMPFNYIATQPTLTSLGTILPFQLSEGCQHSPSSLALVHGQWTMKKSSHCPKKSEQADAVPVFWIILSFCGCWTALIGFW